MGLQPQRAGGKNQPGGRRTYQPAADFGQDRGAFFLVWTRCSKGTQMFDYSKYLRLDKFPLIWCPGCGDGIVLKSLLRAIDRIGLSKDEITMVSGIGCSSRLPGYVDFNTLHTPHA